MSAKALTCPNCAAGLESTTATTCAFCGTALVVEGAPGPQPARAEPALRCPSCAATFSDEADLLAHHAARHAAPARPLAQAAPAAPARSLAPAPPTPPAPAAAPPSPASSGLPAAQGGCVPTLLALVVLVMIASVVATQLPLKRLFHSNRASSPPPQSVQCLMCEGRGKRSCGMCNGTGKTRGGGACDFFDCGGKGQLVCGPCKGAGAVKK